MLYEPKGLGATFAYVIDESLSKSNLEKSKIEVLENLNRRSEEYWGRIMEVYTDFLLRDLQLCVTQSFNSDHRKL